MPPDVPLSGVAPLLLPLGALLGVLGAAPGLGEVSGVADGELVVVPGSLGAAVGEFVVAPGVLVAVPGVCVFAPGILLGLAVPGVVLWVPMDPVAPVPVCPVCPAAEPAPAPVPAPAPAPPADWANAQHPHSNKIPVNNKNLRFIGPSMSE